MTESLLVATHKKSDECGCYGDAYPRKVDEASVVTSTIIVCAAILHLWGVLHLEPVAVVWRLLGIVLMGGVGSWLIWRIWLKRKRQPSIVRVVIPPSL